MGRKVITLNPEAFDSACKRLEKSVAKSGFIPDMILSIRTGGLYVGESIFPDIPHTSVKLQRPSTKAKRPCLHKLLKILPRPILDRLRIAESLWLERKKQTKPRPSLILPQLTEVKRILVVDDAVDSGFTLFTVMDAVKTARPDADIRSAVITQTTISPMIVPDYTLYNNQILIRFPWSMDV